MLGRVPGDLRERRARQRFLEYLDRLPRPCDRLWGPVHVTASAIVTGPPGIVLHRHKRLGLWLQPGGHLDPGELPHEAARREGVEETGLPLRQPPGGPTLVHLDVHPAGSHLHLDLRYLLLAAGRQPRPAAGESQEVRWFSWTEAMAIADQALVGALREVAGGRYRRPPVLDRRRRIAV